MTTTSSDLAVLRNRTFDEIAVGDHASIERTLSAADIQLFAAMSGDINPQHIDAAFAASRADSRESRIGSCAVALVAARRNAKPGAITGLPSAQRAFAPAVAAQTPVALELHP